MRLVPSLVGKCPGRRDEGVGIVAGLDPGAMTGQLESRGSDRATRLECRGIAREKIGIEQLPDGAHGECHLRDRRINRERRVVERLRGAVMKE